MALQIDDRVWDLTVTIGTGVITLSNSPPNAFQSFGSVCSTGDTIYYALAGRLTNVWEVGLGTYNASGPTLTRTTVFASSAGGSAVALSGVTDVMGVWPASKFKALLSSTLFDVTKYGATGDGSTDDTTAINAAIAAFNTATKGVLYFPAGTYKTTTALTTITANGIIGGDGMAYGGAATSVINNTTTNASVFTITNAYLKFKDISIVNTAVSTPVAGSAGITVTSANAGQRCDYDSVFVSAFYINVDVQTGSAWSMHNMTSNAPVLYGIKIRNINNPDSGDWAISNSIVINVVNTNPAAGIRIESSGGGKIVNTKVISDTTIHGFVNGIDVEGAGNTIDLSIVGCSIEGFTGDGIHLSGAWNNISIVSCEIGSFNGAVNGISVINNSNVAIVGIVFADNLSGNVINLSGSNKIHVSGITNNTSAPLFGAGAFPDQDGSGGIGGGQYFGFTKSSPESRLTWTAPSGLYAELIVALNAASTTAAAEVRAVNDAGKQLQMIITGSAAGGVAALASDVSLALTSDAAISSGGTDDVFIRAGGNTQTVMTISHTGSVVTGLGAPATNATDGFLYIPACAGTPTGVPTTQTGRVPMVYDSTNNKFYIYNSGWKGGTVPGAFS